MKRFVAGLLIGASLMTGVGYAAGAKIEVSFRPLKYYFDGVEKVPASDKAGFIYNSTTYVPLRFIAEALGSEVTWDEKSNSIYMGEKPVGTAPKVDEVSHQNGTYRGAYIDGGQMQVGVEFKLENNIVKSFALKHLEYKSVNYLKEQEDQNIIGIRGQYEKLAEYLVGKDIRDHLSALHKPGEIVTENVDAFTGATLRSGKIISSTKDALNRGVYKY